VGSVFKNDEEETTKTAKTNIRGLNFNANSNMTTTGLADRDKKGIQISELNDIQDVFKIKVRDQAYLIKDKG